MLGETMRRIELPWPPSVNAYWTPRRGGGVMLADAGRAYRDSVMLAVLQQGKQPTMAKKLKVRIEAFPPDNRQRDLDNLFKGILDGLEKAGVYHCDYQIDDLRIVRMPVVKGGNIIVNIEEIE